MTLMNMDHYSNQPLPQDWEIEEVLGDIIMAEYVDMTDDGDYIKRDGIMIKLEINTKVWRVAQVIKVGPDCSDRLKVGDHIMFPQDRGLKAAKFHGNKNVVFINEPRIFGICKKVEKVNE